MGLRGHPGVHRRYPANLSVPYPEGHCWAVLGLDLEGVLGAEEEPGYQELGGCSRLCGKEWISLRDCCGRHLQEECTLLGERPTTAMHHGGQQGGCGDYQLGTGQMGGTYKPRGAMG